MPGQGNRIDFVTGAPEKYASLVDGLAVDYEGVLPATQMGGDPNVNVNRTAVIGSVSAESPNGLQTIIDGYRGPTADAFAYTAACSG